MAGMGYGFIHTLNSLIYICDELLLLLVGAVLLYAAYRLRVLADQAEGGKLRLAWMGTATLAVAMLLDPLLMLFVRLVNFVIGRSGFWELMDYTYLFGGLLSLCLALVALAGAGMFAAGLSKDRG